MALDIKSIEVIRTDLIRLQGEVAQKNSRISTLSTEKSQLLAERQQLADQLVVANSSLKTTKSEFIAATTALSVEKKSLLNDLAQRNTEIKTLGITLSAREKELSELKNKYSELIKTGSSSEAMLIELSDIKIQNEFHKTQLLTRNQYYQQISVELDSFRAATSRLQAEKDGIEKVLKAEQEKRGVLEQELTAVRGRSEFGAIELSGYLNNAIDTFNSQTNLADNSINYIISELQVDLKAGIGTTGGSALTMVAPPQTQLTDQGLSSFKFTIRAVPQSTES